MGSRGFRNGFPNYHHQCPLGSEASHLIYDDVRLCIPMTHNNINRSTPVWAFHTLGAVQEMITRRE